MIELTFIFIVTIIFIFFIKKYASSLGLLDIPNERSTHTNQTPRGAGIAFSFASLLGIILFHFDLAYSNKWVMLAILLVLIVGMLDDRHDTSPKTKFIIIILSTILLNCDDIVIDNLGIFFGYELSLGWFALPFTIFAVSGFTNALNLIDGLDGLAASVSIVILGTFLYIGYINDDSFMMILSSTFIVSLFAFLLFNWHPASIFMGDSGSLTLGFVISTLSIKSLAYMPTVSILFIASIPILDTLIVMIRRKRTGHSAFRADRCHMHHILRHFFKENTVKTVLFFIVLQLIYSLTGTLFEKGSDEGIILFLYLLNVALLYLMINAMISRQNRVC